jgi:phosphomannomutase
VLVAHDTRYLGPILAAQALAALDAAGVRALRAASPVPTPVVTHAVRRGAADAALVFTASHNPPEYHGAKAIAGWGGGVTDTQARRIEALARGALARPRAPGARAKRSFAEIDCVGPYLRRLRELVDRDAFRGARLAVFYDALHGTGAGVCDRALAALGARVERVRGDRSPRFGGAAPDPLPERLGPLARRVRGAAGLRIGLATDGDADRFAVLDADGSPLSEAEALALLVDHLASSGRIRRGVALSIATGSLVERVAVAHGLRVERHPIGFKHLARALARGSADVAGEESGGFAVDALGRDKDGILACALLAEIAAATRAPLRQRLRALVRQHGPSACGRLAVAADARRRERLARLARATPQRVGRARVRAVDARDGLRFAFDDGFLMLRASGTEPVLRVYAEARDRASLAQRLDAGLRLLAGDPRAR